MSEDEGLGFAVLTMVPVLPYSLVAGSPHGPELVVDEGRNQSWFKAVLWTFQPGIEPQTFIQIVPTTNS